MQSKMGKDTELDYDVSFPDEVLEDDSSTFDGDELDLGETDGESEIFPDD